MTPFEFVAPLNHAGGTVTCPIRREPAPLPAYVHPSDRCRLPVPVAAPITPAGPDEIRPLVTDMRSFLTTPAADLERHFWAHGQPALPGEPLGPRPVVTPDEMDLDTLIATQSDGGLPSLAKAAWLAGARVDSLDHTFDTDDGDSATLADTIPAAVVENTGFLTTVALEDMTPEEHAAYKSFVARKAEEAPDPVVYTAPDATARQRVTWERHRHAAGSVARYGLRPNNDGGMDFYALAGRRLDRDAFLRAKRRWVRDFLDRTGLDRVPKAQAFADKAAAMAQFRDSVTASNLHNLGDAESAAAVDMLAHDEGVHDDGLNFEVRDEPYVPELATIRYAVERDEQWQYSTLRLAGLVNPDGSPRATERKVERFLRLEIAVEAIRRHRALVLAAYGPDDEPIEHKQLVALRSPRAVEMFRRTPNHPDLFWRGSEADSDSAPFLVELGFSD